MTRMDSEKEIGQNDMQTLIIIPARSGSKGVENKNIRPLGGKPLLAWSIEAAIEAGIEHSVTIVSTDSDRYAEIARQHGALVPFIRPDHCAGDKASALDVIIHALDWFKENRGQAPQQVMWLQPTSPFRSADNLRSAMRMLDANQADSVIGCKAIDRDLTTLFKLDGNGYLHALDDSRKTQTRRQDIDALLTPNGALYLARTELLRRRGSFYGEKTLPLLMNALQSIDIDTLLDWQIAEACMNQGLMNER